MKLRKILEDTTTARGYGKAHNEPTIDPRFCAGKQAQNDTFDREVLDDED